MAMAYVVIQQAIDGRDVEWSEDIGDEHIASLKSVSSGLLDDHHQQQRSDTQAATSRPENTSMDSATIIAIAQRPLE